MGDINKQLGKRLRELRKKNGWTQEKLAQASGVDYKYIQRLKGKTPSSPSLNIIEKFAKAFQIKISELLAQVYHEIRKNFYNPLTIGQLQEN